MLFDKDNRGNWIKDYHIIASPPAVMPLPCVVLLAVLTMARPALGAYDYCRSTWDPLGKAAIDTRTAYVPGDVRSLGVFFCQRKQVSVQVWEQVEAGVRRIYQLRWAYDVPPPAAVPARVVINLSAPFPALTNRSRLGLHTPDGALPAGTVFSGEGKVAPTIFAERRFRLGDEYEVETLDFPFIFNAQLCEQRDCPAPPEPTGPPTPPPLIPGDTVACLSPPPLSPVGRAVVQRSRPPTPGLARALETYFCRDQDVEVQVWETQAADDSLRLVWRKTLAGVAPSDSGATSVVKKTVVTFSPLEYVLLTPQHRVGLHVADPAAAVPVAAAYSPDSADVVVADAAQQQYQLQTAYTFDQLTFPYEFRIRFCPEIDCPGPTTEAPLTTAATTAQVTTETVTTEVVTTELVTTEETTSEITTDDFTLESMTVAGTTDATTFDNVTMASSSTASAWESTVDSSTTAVWQSTADATITVIGPDENFTTPAFPSTPGPAGPPGFIGPPGAIGPEGPKGARGDQGVAGLPGLNGAPGVTGQQGAQGVSGPVGPQGDTGPAGDTGALGPKGPSGDNGDPGAQGQAGPEGPSLAALYDDVPTATNSTCTCHPLQDRYIVLGMLLWAVLLTLLTLMLAVMATAAPARATPRWYYTQGVSHAPHYKVR